MFSKIGFLVSLFSLILMCLSMFRYIYFFLFISFNIFYYKIYKIQYGKFFKLYLWYKKKQLQKLINTKCGSIQKSVALKKIIFINIYFFSLAFLQIFVVATRSVILLIFYIFIIFIPLKFKFFYGLLIQFLIIHIHYIIGLNLLIFNNCVIELLKKKAYYNIIIKKFNKPFNELKWITIVNFIIYNDSIEINEIVIEKYFLYYFFNYFYFVLMFLNWIFNVIFKRNKKEEEKKQDKSKKNNNNNNNNNWFMNAAVNHFNRFLKMMDRIMEHNFFYVAYQIKFGKQKNKKKIKIGMLLKYTIYKWKRLIITYIYFLNIKIKYVFLYYRWLISYYIINPVFAFFLRENIKINLIIYNSYLGLKYIKSIILFCYQKWLKKKWC